MSKSSLGSYTKFSDLPPFDYDDMFVYTKGKEPKKSGIIDIIEGNNEQYEDQTLSELNNDKQQILSQFDYKILDNLSEDFSHQIENNESFYSCFQIPNDHNFSKISHFQEQINKTEMSIQNYIDNQKQAKKLSFIVKLKHIKKVRIKKIILDVVCYQQNCSCSQIELKRDGKTNIFQKTQKQSCICCAQCLLKINAFSLDAQTKQPVIISYDSFRKAQIYSIEFNKRCCSSNYTSGNENVICYGSSKIATPFCIDCSKTQEIEIIQSVLE